MENLRLIYYSPTGTTQTIVREVGQNLGLKLVSEINIAKNRITTAIDSSSSCLTIIGMPVYGGRLPLTAIESLKQLRSNNSPVVIVVVYGNRHFDDALLELKEIVSSCGFSVIAGAAFIGEHSYSTRLKPIAQNRPDKQDIEKCKVFAQMILEKTTNAPIECKPAAPIIPGSYPYKERRQFPATIQPIVNNDLCILCGICVDACPTSAITIRQTVIPNGELCTLCCACVKQCPQGALTLNHPLLEPIKENLFLNFSVRKEPQFFV